MAEDDPNVAYREFATSRSHQDAQVSNENARATGQALIIINGGAASAIIAFLSKERIESGASVIAVCLSLYAIGAFCGAAMMYCKIKSLDWWNVHWRRQAFPAAAGDRGAQQLAGRWLKGAEICFIISGGAFLISSLVMAIVLLWFRAKSVPFYE
jgi:hypothetical protein